MKDDLDSVIALSRRVEQHSWRILTATSFKDNDALDRVILQMASRVLEFHRACHRLAEHRADTPVAMSCLARAHYETVLTTMYIIAPRTQEERIELARKFIEFAEYQQIKLLKPGNKEYRDSLSPKEQKNFDRRVEVYLHVKANFSEKQKEQLTKGEATWNGLGFAGTAKSLDWEKSHREWYGMLCLATHPSAAMFHKSVTFTDTRVLLSQPDQGMSDSKDKLLLVARWTFVFASFVRVIRQIEPGQMEGISLCSDLGGFAELARRLYAMPSSE